MADTVTEAAVGEAIAMVEVIVTVPESRIVLEVVGFSENWASEIAVKVIVTNMSVDALLGSRNGLEAMSSGSLDEIEILRSLAGDSRASSERLLGRGN